VSKSTETSHIAGWGGVNILALLLCLCGGPSFALPLTTPLNPPPSRTVQGEILRIQGDLYLIKPLAPSAGKEIRLRVDDKTVRIDAETFKIGDVIIADVTPEGHALVITPLIRTDTPESSGPAAATR
jgi:hypothetical protein